MHLEGQRLLDREQLHQERQPGAVLGVDPGPEQRDRVAGDRAVETQAVGEQRRVALVGADPQLGLGRPRGVAAPGTAPGAVVDPQA